MRTPRSIAIEVLQSENSRRVLLVGFQDEFDLAEVVKAIGVDAMVLALDLSLDSVKALKDRDKHPSSAFGCCAAPTVLPVSNSSVDALVSTYSPRLLPSELSLVMLAEFHRVLVPGGHLLFLHRSGQNIQRASDGVLPDGITEVTLMKSGFGSFQWQEIPSKFTLAGVVVARRNVMARQEG